MKSVILAIVLMFGAMVQTASATSWEDVIGALVGADQGHQFDRGGGWDRGPGRGGWDHGPGGGWDHGPGGGWDHGGGGWDRNVQCTSYDNGWEEHWGGHGSCQECLSKHGGCTEICERVNTLYSCQFEGSDMNGRRETFIGEDYDRRNAEYASENRCYRAGYRYCRYLGCNSKQDRQQVSRRSCR